MTALPTVLASYDLALLVPPVAGVAVPEVEVGDVQTKVCTLFGNEWPID